MHKVTLFLFCFPYLTKLGFCPNRGVVCGPVSVLFESNGQSLKLGEIKLRDRQVFQNVFIAYQPIGLENNPMFASVALPRKPQAILFR